MTYSRKHLGLLFILISILILVYHETKIEYLIPISTGLLTYIGVNMMFGKDECINKSTNYTTEQQKDRVNLCISKTDGTNPNTFTKKDGDAGFDIYPLFNEKMIKIPAHSTKMIPTGIKTAFSEDYVAILKERGSTGSKGIGQRCGVIDSSYRGEWFIPLTNHNKVPIYIIKDDAKDFDKYKEKEDMGKAIVYPYSKAIAQTVFIKMPKVNQIEVTDNEIAVIPSHRGEGALGSSGK